MYKKCIINFASFVKNKDDPCEKEVYFKSMKSKSKKSMYEIIYLKRIYRVNCNVFRHDICN